MKNKILSRVMVLLTALALLVPLPVYAAETGTDDDIVTDTPYSDSVSDLNKRLNNLNERISDLSERISATPSNPPVYEPLVKVLSPQTISADPGDTLDVAITVRNIGTSGAYSVLTQAKTDTSISVEFIDNSNSANLIPENASHNMLMTIKISSKIEPGPYKINLTHLYKTKDQKNKETPDEITVQVAGSTDTEANVTLGAFSSSMNSIAPGGSVELTSKIRNMGDGEATQVSVTYEPTEFADTIMTIADMILTSDPYYFSTMEAGYEGDIKFTFRASSDAEKGTYPIKIKLSYKNTEGEVKESTVPASITVSTENEAAKDPDVQIRDLTAPSGIFEVGESAGFSLRVVNTGAGKAERIKITAKAADEAAVVPTSGNIVQIASLNPGAEQLLNFSFAATETAKTQSYVVGFHVEYYTGEETDDSKEAVLLTYDQYASFGVNNPEEEEKTEDDKTSKPKMIVSEYTVTPQVVQAGQEFDLNIKFQNTSSVKAIENIKVTIEALEVTEDKGSVFNPVSGSNTVFIDKMGIKEEVEQNLKFYTVSDAEARSYKLQVKFQYQDEDLNDYEETEQLAINVKQTTRLEITDFFAPETAMVGEEIYFYVSIINTGRVTVSNLRVRMDIAEGSEFEKKTDRYLANVAKGNQVSYDGSITMTTPGLQSGTFVAYGEDDTGEPVEMAIDFTIDVTDGGGMDGDMMGDPGMMDPGMDPGMTEEQPQGIMGFISNPWVWGTGAAIVVIAVIIIVIKVRQRKKRVDFDE